MKFDYTGRHIDVTSALKSHVEEQFNKFGHLFDGKPARVHTTIEVERGRHRSEMVVKWRNEVLTATSKTSDMYTSLSQTAAKIEKQALKLKNKVIDKSHKAKKTGVIGEKSVAVKPALDEPRIVRSRKYVVKPMTAEEAVMELKNDRENSFVVFRDADTDRVSVLYLRKDKNYGLIEP